MSLKTRIRLSIVALVTIVVVGLAALYVYDLTILAFDDASSRADLVSAQVKDYLLEQLREQTIARQAKPVTLTDYKALWTDIVRTDVSIPIMLERAVANADVVVRIQISGEDGSTLVASSPYLAGSPAPLKHDFSSIHKRNAFLNLWDLETRPEDYIKTVPIGVESEPDPIFKISVVVRSTLLRAAMQDAFRRVAVAFLLTIAVGIALAGILSHIVLIPVERLEQTIDRIQTDDSDPQPRRSRHETREFAAVQSKLDLLGQQFRGAKQDAVTLRSNVEDMLQRLEEAVLLFDSEERLTMAGHAADRLLGIKSDQSIGMKIDELFPPSTVLGTLIGDAIRHSTPLHDQVATIERDSRKTRVLLNLEILMKNGAEYGGGTLITLRDVESRRQLQMQIDVSSRLAAIGRLTGGVAHEIKNPLNAMALHLELLRAKLDESDPEIEVLSKEIRRLDHVVKTFLAFSKPIELKAQPLDLNQLAEGVVNLIRPDARSKGVRIETDLRFPHWISGDSTLLHQAVLNIVMNGLEAMKDGGVLTISTADDGNESSLRISDTGPGIPVDIQNKIFNLYFSTKPAGSGIGLATTFQVVQLHNGTIDVESNSGQGAAFRLRFPLLSVYEEPRVVSRATS